MTIVQKWLSGLLGLGALYMVLAQPKSVARVAGAIKNLTAGSIVSIESGGRR